MRINELRHRDVKVLLERCEGRLGVGGGGVPVGWGVVAPDLVPPGTLGGSDLGQKPVPLSSCIT